MNNFDTHRDDFATLLPQLECMAAAAFRYLDPEARQEAVQNAICLTWHAYHNLIEKGRGEEEGIIKSCLWYSIKQTRAGRTVPSGGETKPKDAFAYAKKGRVRFESVQLKHFVSDDTPIPDVVSFRVDVPAFLSTLSDRQQRMAEDLMSGMKTGECAKKYGVTAGAVSQFRVRFKELFETFMAA